VVIRDRNINNKNTFRSYLSIEISIYHETNITIIKLSTITDNYNIEHFVVI
jgi:phage-related protein